MILVTPATPPPRRYRSPIPRPRLIRRCSPSAVSSARRSVLETTMLKHKLIHPKISEILARAGHHATILIADGGYPASTKKGPNAELVCLNLMPGVVNCTQTLEAILSAVPVDEVNTMMYTKEDPYALDKDPPVWDEYRAVLRRA